MNKLFNVKDYECLIGHSNPFGLILDGRVLFFRGGLQQVYLFVMEALAYEFPRGYVDLRIFMVTYTALSWTDAFRFCKSLKVYGLDDCIELYLGEKTNERTNTLSKLMRGLHSVTHTSFSESCLIAAICQFDELFDFDKNNNAQLISPYNFKDVDYVWQ